MKKKIFLIGLIGIVTFSLVGCGSKKNDVDVSNLNDGINNLLGDLPNDEISIDVDLNHGELIYDEYDDSNNSSNLTEEDLAHKEAIKEAEEFADKIMRSSEDAIPKDLNFSFYDYCYEVPKEFEYYGLTFLVEKTDFIGTSISMNSPSLFLTTGLPFYNDEQKQQLNEKYQTLMKGIINDYSPILAGQNYSVFNIMDINTDYMSGMVFDYTDCYVVVRSYFTEYKDKVDENGDTGKMILINIGYISKNELHVYEGADYDAIKYIQKVVPNADFKFYYYDEDGKGFTLDKDSISLENAFMMY